MRDLLRVAAVLLLALVLPGRAGAAEPTPTEVDPVLARMQAAYAEVPVVQARFTQTLSGFSYFEPVTRRGAIALQKPGRMSMRFEGAQATEYRTDGSTLWVLDEGAKTATVYRTAAAQITRLFDFLTGAANVRQDFRVSLGEASEGSRLVLVPKVEDANMARVELRVDERGFVRGVVWETAFGDRTETLLEELKTDEPLPAERFSWTAPAGWIEVAGD